MQKKKLNEPNSYQVQGKLLTNIYNKLVSDNKNMQWYKSLILGNASENEIIQGIMILPDHT